MLQGDRSSLCCLFISLLINEHSLIASDSSFPPLVLFSSLSIKLQKGVEREFPFRWWKEGDFATLIFKNGRDFRHLLV